MKKPPTQRQLRVGEQIKHIIADLMSRGDFHSDVPIDPSMVTVTEVRPSPDLKNATVFVVAHDSLDREDFIPALNEEAPFFQKEINKQSNLKFTPRLTFKYDEAFNKAQRIEDILRDVHYSEQDS